MLQVADAKSRTQEAVYRYQEEAERFEEQRRAVERQARDAVLGVVTGISRVQGAFLQRNGR